MPFFAEAVERKFPGTGGLAYKEARASIISLGNEKRDHEKKKAFAEAEKDEEMAARYETRGEIEEADRLRQAAKEMRKRAVKKYDVSKLRHISDNDVSLENGDTETSGLFVED